MSYKIEKGIPMPDRSRNGSFCSTLRQLEIGDSFLIDDRKNRGGLYVMAKENKIKICVREEGVQLRIWRIE